MDPRDASIHNRQPPPPQQQKQPPPVMMPPPPFAFGHHFPNNSVFMMGAPNLISNPNFSFNPSTAPHPFDSGVVTHQHQNQQQPHQLQTQQQQQQQRNGSPVPGVSAAAPDATVGSEKEKKKRGRPRKYSPDPDSTTLGLSSNSQAVSKAAAGAGDGHNEAGEGNAEEGSREKRQRGRPPGSGKKKLDALGGDEGAGFTMHVFVIPAGENIVSKLVDLSQEGPRTICILSANGTVHNVTLRQVAGGTLYHEGQFEIISLSGSFCCVNTDGSQNNTLNLTATLAGPDGRLVGGGVTRELIAASSIQIVAGSFLADRKQSNTSIPITSPLPTPAPRMLSFGSSASPNNSTQHDVTSDSSDDDSNGYGHGHPVNQNPGHHNFGQPWTRRTPGWA